MTTATELPSSGTMPFSQGVGIRLFGTEGVIYYDLAADRLWGRSRKSLTANKSDTALEEIEIPASMARKWRVEADFVDAIRGGKPIEFTDFATGVRYMEFTEAVARSAQRGKMIDLPLEDFKDADRIG